MSSIEFIVTRETEDSSDDLPLVVDYTYSAHGIDHEAKDADGNLVTLTEAEQERLFEKIREEAAEE